MNQRKPFNARKLTAEKAREIRVRHGDGESILKLARDYGVSDQAIKDVLNYETWGSAGPPRKQ